MAKATNMRALNIVFSKDFRWSEGICGIDDCRLLVVEAKHKSRHIGERQEKRKIRVKLPERAGK